MFDSQADKSMPKLSHNIEVMPMLERYHPHNFPFMFIRLSLHSWLSMKLLLEHSTRCILVSGCIHKTNSVVNRMCRVDWKWFLKSFLGLRSEVEYVCSLWSTTNSSGKVVTLKATLQHRRHKINSAIVKLELTNAYFDCIEFSDCHETSPKHVTVDSRQSNLDFIRSCFVREGRGK